MARDEAISIAEGYARTKDFPWEGRVYAEREWMWRRFWFRWVVTAPAPVQIGSLRFSIHYQTQSFEDLFISTHVYELRRDPPSFFDFYPRPLWYQFLTAPVRLLVFMPFLLMDGVDWMVEKYRLSRMPHCPRCGAMLRTSVAEQCPACHLEWHGRAMPRF